MPEPLNDAERLTLGALLRTLFRLDGTITPEEQAVVYGVVRELLPLASGEDVGQALARLLERSAERCRDDESVRAAAESVTRPEAREAIFAALYQVSLVGTITQGESSLLDWLARTWDIRVGDA